MINLNSLTLEEKVGQMIMVGLNGSSVNERIKKLIQENKIGEIILYKKIEHSIKHK